MDPARLEALSRRIAEERRELELPPTARRAAVAAALREASHGPEVLLMRRAERADDRWSGQISLPGGHVEPIDPDLVATAVRETREEVGLDLVRDARFIGTMTPIQARARGGRLDTWITPAVFHYHGEGAFALGPEATDAFWFPLEAARRGDLDEVLPYEDKGAVHRLPSWRHGSHVVWGLTHRIVTELLRLLPRGPL